MKMDLSVAVVTANFGGMDSIKPIPEQSIPFERFVFDERNSPFPFPALDNRMKARYFKLLTHEILDHDVFVWVDGNVEIKSPKFLEMVVEHLHGNDIVIRRHPERSDIFEEAESIVAAMAQGNAYLRARYYGHPLIEEVEAYRAAGHPEGFGLWWCGLFARANSARVNVAFKRWWDDGLKWNNFDQSCFAEQVRVFELKVATQEWSPYYNNKHLAINHHQKIQ